MNIINQIWPQWKVVDELGSGAFGTVYKAKREGRGNTSYSAIKVIQIPKDGSVIKDLKYSGMNEQSVRHYFDKITENVLNEIKIMEELKSANNIVSIEDYEIVSNEEKCEYKILIRMELLQDLHTYLNVNTLSTEETVRLGMDICNALISCHSVNVIHRDIKIGNIFINKFGNFKLGDFGIAKQMEHLTQGMSHKGTNLYMAPEVFNGREYDCSVDTYSLGLVMYRMLNHGRLPFIPPFPAEYSYQEQSDAMLKRLSGAEILPPANCDKKLSQIILKACSYKVEGRYDSAQSMYNDLKHYYEAMKFQKKEIRNIYDEPLTTVIDHADDLGEQETNIIGMDDMAEQETSIIGNYDNKEDNGAVGTQETNNNVENSTLKQDNLDKNYQEEIIKTEKSSIKKKIIIGVVAAILVVGVVATFGIIKNNSNKNEESTTQVNYAIDNGLNICMEGTTTPRNYRSIQISKDSEVFYISLEKEQMKKYTIENDNEDSFEVVQPEDGRFYVRAKAEGTGTVKVTVATESNKVLARKLYISVYTRMDNYYGKTNDDVNVYRGAGTYVNVGNKNQKDKLKIYTKVKVIASCNDFYLIKLTDGSVFSDNRPTGYVSKDDIIIDE